MDKVLTEKDIYEQTCRCGHRRLCHMWPKVDGPCEHTACECEGYRDG